MYEPSRSYLDCHLAGFTHWDGVDAFKELEVGSPLSLVPEPDNPFDQKSVAVYYGDLKLGYIPSKYNGRLSPLLIFGPEDLFEVFVNHISEDHHPEGQIGIIVKIKDSRKSN